MTTGSNRSTVLTGLDVLLRDGAKHLEHRTLGVVTNHTAVTRDLASIVDALHADERFTVARLFAPEHGVRGAAQAGDAVADETDAATGLQVVSLYGANRTPTPEQLAGLDAILYDLQDVGARHYTYISTLVHVMQACAPLDLPVVVLDRPNPITGLNAEGKVLEPEFLSFVGIHPMPTRHGLSIGELALLIAHDLGLSAPEVIRCEGWTRDMWWDDTDLPFVYPSPNLPTLDSLITYTATCIIEATTCSEGRGTTRPFELVGAPWVDANWLAGEMNGRDLPGVRFRATGFTPWISKHKGELCYGVQLHVTDRHAFRPVSTGVHLIHALNLQPGSQFNWTSGPALGMSHGRLYGSTELRTMIDAGQSAEAIIATWQPGLDACIAHASEFHLYSWEPDMTTEMPQSDDAIQRATGKNWSEWRALLDAWGGVDKPHPEIATYLVDEHGVDGWWAQGVTVGYERMIGRREVGQRNDGSYSASASKTVNASIENVHAALVHAATRAMWLPEGVVEFRTASGTKSARFDDLEAGVIIAFHLTHKGNKTAVQVQADKFASQDAADAWKAAWKPRLNDLAKHFS